MDESLMIREEDATPGNLPEQSTRRLSLLLAEDNPLVAYVLASAVEECGCIALKTNSWATFVEGLDAHEPDGVALDLSIRGCDGGQILRELAQRSYSGMVLIVSGLDSQQIEDARLLGLSLGLHMAEPLAKPFRYDDLAERLKLLKPLAGERVAQSVE
jgi:CheY-like chemotaxis protein